MAVTELRQRMIDFSVRELGQTESPPGSNRGPRVSMYQTYDSLPGDGYAWCCSFAWCYVGAKAAEIPRVPYPSASVGNTRNYFQQKGALRWSPQPGYLVFFDWDTLTGPRKGDWPDHIGVVLGQDEEQVVRLLPADRRDEFMRAVAVQGKAGLGQFWACEGNTSFGNDSNGGNVMFRRRGLIQVEAFGDPDVILNAPEPKPVKWETVVGVRGTKEARVIGPHDAKVLRDLIKKNPILAKYIKVGPRRQK